VYSVTPLYHPSGLMMSVGGAVAGGARLALATEFEPSRFWQEVRRYGVTVTSYTWTMLHDLVEAPPQPGERHHPVRLFIGSGMPSGLWRRVRRRFHPARVLEFYASTETGAILVNVSDAKPGAMGRPLPGSPELRLAAYDVQTGQLLLGDDGFVRRCGSDEVGMLLARARESDGTRMISLRGVFSRDDAWLATADLFRRDSDGDYWRLDGVRDLIRTAAGPVCTTPIRHALGTLPAVDLAVAYGVPGRDGHELAVAAITLRHGHSLDAQSLSGALGSLPAFERPAVVRVVEEIPVTTWYRPLTGPLREEGIPAPREGDREGEDEGDVKGAWYLDRGGKTYRPLSAAARKRLAAPAEPWNAE
jgi:putative long chain acyl-CoA synthase